MTPAAALASPIFRFYVALIVILLLLAGGILVLLRWKSPRDVTSAWKAYCGWLLMIPVVFGAIFLGRIATIILFTILSLLGFKEFARATGLYRDWAMTGAVYLSVIAVGIVSLVHDPTTGVPGWFGLFMALPVYAISAFLLLPIARDRVQGQLQTLALAILGFIYIGWMFGHFAYLANAQDAYGYLLYLLFAVELNDIAAFTCGKLFGRHPLRPNVSPNKTWEGAIGALAVSLALPWLLHFSFPHFGPWQCILTGLVVGIGGQLGDLSISVIKRDLGVKDMGAILQGHGGILDRIDSLIFVAPLFLHVTRYFYDL
jgi:phosphatidate cytidylyltransferase